MDRNTMKNRIKSLRLWVLSCAMLIAGVQSASASLAGCEGTVYLKLPEGWTTAYSVAGGQFIGFKKSTQYPSWYEISSALIGGANPQNEFNISKALNDYGQAGGITRTVIGSNVQFGTGTGFTCKDFGKNTNELWIQPDFDDPTKPYVKGEPPDVKYFYVFLPNNETWKSAVPFLVEDGKDHEMNIDPDNCGWYFRRYVDEALPSSIFIRRDDDEDKIDMMGMDGDAQTGAADSLTPIALGTIYKAFEKDAKFQGGVFFVADGAKAKENPSDVPGWYVERPLVTGTCSYPLAAFIYDTDASLHGAFTCSHYETQCDGNPDVCKNNACFYSTAKYNVVPNASEVVPCIGVKKGMVEDTLYRDGNGKKYMKLTAKGKTCFGSDAENAFKAMFNYTPGVNEKYCFNMTFEQTPDGKYEFESDTYRSPGATAVGGFYPAEEPPLEKGMKSEDKPVMLSERLPAAENKRRAEGPVFFCPDYNNQKTTTPEGLRTIHPTEGVALSDLICSGPGWEGGIDCEGLFAAGGEFKETEQAGVQIRKNLKVSFEGDGWGWGCQQMAPIGWTFYTENSEDSVGVMAVKNQPPAKGQYRWTSGTDDSKVLTTEGRNQHFCFESHAKFRFKKGLKFSFRGDDDIWVFINDKLAVDLGGTHLAAPGYVDLDKFMGSYAEVGTSYPIDIFFCDRRTTMSNVHIKTNMFIEQKSGIETTERYDRKDWNTTGTNQVKICYSKSSNGSCAAEADPDGKDVDACDDEIEKMGLKTSFVLTTDKSNTDPTAVKISAEEFAKNPVQFDGFLDVTHPGRPKFTPDSLRNYLKPGNYYLIETIEKDSYPILIQIKGSVNVANRDAVFVDGNNNKSLVYKHISSKMASTLKDDGTPDPDQMIPLYIASITDPCNNVPTCTDPLEMSESGDQYSLKSTNQNVLFYEMKNGVLNSIDPAAKRTPSASGIDTVYVTIPFDGMTKAVEKAEISVVGGNRKAELSFFVPRLKFVASATSMDEVKGDKDTDKRLKGTAYEFYVVAVDDRDSLCTTCSHIKLKQGQGSDPGVDMISDAELINGRVTITIRSSKVYERKADGSGTATFEIRGPSKNLMVATYNNMQFQEPPVPTPQFADIFDVYGAPVGEMNMPLEYFDKNKDYLDGIGDSIVVYYHREFNKDSLPEKIEISWSTDTTVVFDAAAIAAGSACGVAKGASADTLCLPRITLGGKDIKLSKKVKTSGMGKLKSWATYCPRRKDDGTCGTTPVTQDYDGIIYDRIAPVIISARAMTDTDEDKAQLKITFSEEVQKTAQGVGEGDKVFSFYINNTKTPTFHESLPLLTGIAFPQILGENLILTYDKKNVFPQSGDYIHFRSIGGVGLVQDRSMYDSIPGADSIRAETNHLWNTAPGFDATDRVPSPWALVSGDVNAYIVRLVPDAKDGVPSDLTDPTALPITEVFTFDAFKDENDFKNAIIDKNTDFDPEFRKYGFFPHGWFAKVDLGAMVESKEDSVIYQLDKVYFDYEIQVFTNLGSHVLTNHKRIYCEDNKNFKENGKYYYGGANANCVENRKNFFIVWNMKGAKNRLVGTGAYVSKIKAYANLGSRGKTFKSNKTEMWGVRHNSHIKGTIPEPKK